VNEPAAAALFLGLFGRPLPGTTAAGERLSSVQALPILASDALSSAAYATEAALEAWRSAATVSDQVMAVWVRSDEDDVARIRRDCERLVGASPGISLQILESPFASLIDPFVAFVAAQEQAHPEVSHTIVMPMAIPRYRFDSLLLNQRGINMHRALDASGNRVFTLVRYYLPA
jgi:hypothetical protein